jgi:hypothetical protein
MPLLTVFRFYTESCLFTCCSGRFATGTIAADTIRMLIGAKRLTTSGFSWQRCGQASLPFCLQLIHGDYLQTIWMINKYPE